MRRLCFGPLMPTMYARNARFCFRNGEDKNNRRQLKKIAAR